MHGQETNIIYPSVARLHEKNARFSEKHPIIPPINVYTLLKIMCKKYSDEQAVDCLNVSISFHDLFGMVECFPAH